VIPYDRTTVMIDTGIALHPIGEGADASWLDDLEPSEEDVLDLFVWDGREKRAQLEGLRISGNRMVEAYIRMGLVGPDVQSEDEDDLFNRVSELLILNYIRVPEKWRGGGRSYSTRLLKVVVEEFGRRHQTGVFAEAFSQVIYRNMRKALPLPTWCRPIPRGGAESDPFQPRSDAEVLQHLDEFPVEGTRTLKFGYALANDRSALLLWEPGWDR